MEDGQGMDGGMKGWVDGWMDGQIDGWMDGWVSRSVDGSVDGCPPRGRLLLPLPSSLPLLPSPPARPGRPAAPLPPRGRSAPRPAPPPHLTGGAGAAGPSRAIPDPSHPVRPVPSRPWHACRCCWRWGWGWGWVWGWPPSPRTSRSCSTAASAAASTGKRPLRAPGARRGEGKGKKNNKTPPKLFFFLFSGVAARVPSLPGSFPPPGAFPSFPFLPFLQDASCSGGRFRRLFISLSP